MDRMRRDVHLEVKGVDPTGGHKVTIAFALTYRGMDPDKVAEVANTLAELYVEENLRARETQAAGTAEFLSRELEEARRRLEEQEHRVNEFKSRHMGELPEQVEVNLAALERLNAQLQINNEKQGRLETRADSVAALAAAPAAPTASPGEDLQARIARLRGELAQMSARYSDKYPDVAGLRVEIEGLERRLREQRSRRTPDDAPPRPVLPDSVAEMRALREEERRVRAAIARYEERVENAPLLEQALAQLLRDYEATRATYASLLERRQEAQLAGSLEQRQLGERFRILDAAAPSRIPVAPDRPKLLLAAVVLALALAAGAVALAENLDTSFHSVDELRAFTRVRVLASVPRIVTGSESARRRRRLGLASAAAAAGLALAAAGAHLLARGNDQIVAMLTRG